MPLFSTIALATRGRIIPAGVRKALALASLGWILVGGVIPPTPTPSPFVERARILAGGRYNGEKELLDLLLKEDDEVLIILKSWVKYM